MKRSDLPYIAALLIFVIPLAASSFPQVVNLVESFRIDPEYFWGRYLSMKEGFDERIIVANIICCLLIPFNAFLCLSRIELPQDANWRGGLLCACALLLLVSMFILVLVIGPAHSNSPGKSLRLVSSLSHNRFGFYAFYYAMSAVCAAFIAGIIKLSIGAFTAVFNIRK